MKSHHTPLDIFLDFYLNRAGDASIQSNFAISFMWITITITITDSATETMLTLTHDLCMTLIT
jgi:hypothetical protein